MTYLNSLTALNISFSLVFLCIWSALSMDNQNTRSRRNEVGRTDLNFNDLGIFYMDNQNKSSRRNELRRTDLTFNDLSIFCSTLFKIK